MRRRRKGKSFFFLAKQSVSKNKNSLEIRGLFRLADEQSRFTNCFQKRHYLTETSATDEIGMLLFSFNK